MIRAPRMMPLTRPMMLLTPSITLVTKPSAIVGAAPSVAARASSSACWIDPGDVELFGGVGQGLVGHRTDLIGLVDHAAGGGDDDHEHQQQQSEHDQAGGEGGLDLVPFEHSDERSEHDGEHRGEEHREHDLAHRAEHDHDDDCGDGEPDEGPRPHPDLGHRGPAGGRLDGHRVATAGRRLAAIGDVGFDIDVGGVSHGNRPPGVTGRWIRSCSGVVGAVERVAKAQLVGGCWQRWAGTLGEGL